MKIDLNADIGEGFPGERELLPLVSSVNIACGFHAGDAPTMLQSVRQALHAGVAIGASLSISFDRLGMALTLPLLVLPPPFALFFAPPVPFAFVAAAAAAVDAEAMDVPRDTRLRFDLGSWKV